MDDRKKIIIREIEYWRRNRLLPEVYCTFLLRLYEDKEHDQNERRKGLFTDFTSLLYVTIAISLIALTFLVIYFTQFSSSMQIALLSLILLALGRGLFVTFRKGLAVVHIFIGSCAVLMLYTLVSLAQAMFPGANGALNTVVILACITWMAAGWKTGFVYLFVAGITGLFMLTIASVFF
ncbi:hypothetical protein [Alteribacter keqinensis]|uniref:DUF2157 domain-containing protein n=1 Tax=Alteribacter keqinensis TaxID=2483800 RepID=A0A3M7TTW4_9BACI|nr:hypothetical protein [Alteribacter keqinensis]RNA68883.1 hypothetical protein EBO34_02650 [Alteribacter keqinensis]